MLTLTPRMSNYGRPKARPSTPPVSYFLDTFTDAWDNLSIARQTKTGQTQMALVREDGGGTEAWIGPAAGVLDEASLLTHTGANNGYVKTLKGGNGNTATMATAGQQPQLVSSGTVLKLNGKPVMRTRGSNTGLQTPSFAAQSQPNTIFNVSSWDESGTDYIYGGLNTTTNRHEMLFYSGNTTLFAGSQIATGVDPGAGQKIYSGLYDGVSSVLRTNGAQTANGNVGSHSLTGLTLMNSSNFNLGGYQMQEIIPFFNDQSSNFAAVELDVNTFYGAYA